MTTILIFAHAAAVAEGACATATLKLRSRMAARLMTCRGDVIAALTTAPLVRFYRVTPMHSANYAVAKCMSVHLSVTRRYSV